MLNFLYTGDWHIRGANPRNRTDDYKAAFFAKLEECYQKAEQYDCTAIIMPGDVFHTPEISIATLVEVVGILRKSPVPIYCTVGNHDIYGYNIETYKRSSLLLLHMLVPQFNVATTADKIFCFTDGKDTAVEVTFTPYSAKMDVNGYGYSPEVEYNTTFEQYQHIKHIHVAHGMLLDHTPPFDRYSLLNDVTTTADIVLTGHDHCGYGIKKRKDGKMFCNPGALMRLTAAVSEIERTVQVAIITVDDDKISINLVPINCAAPGDNVLDRSQLEAEQARAYAMDQFSALIETQTGGQVLLDVNHIVEEIAKLDGVPPHVLKAALTAIDIQREKIV